MIIMSVRTCIRVTTICSSVMYEKFAIGSLIILVALYETFATGLAITFVVPTL
jgi:hypothetical protein